MVRGLIQPMDGWLMVELKFDVNEVAPLHQAAEAGLDVVKLLIDPGSLLRDAARRRRLGQV